MFPGSHHQIQLEHDGDAQALRDLAALDEAPSLAVPALIARVDGEPVAALSLVDDRAVADPFRRSAAYVTILRLHASGMRAHAEQPSLIARITRQLRRRGVAPAPVATR